MQGSTFGSDIHSEYILFICYVPVYCTEKIQHSFYILLYIFYVMHRSTFGSDIHSEYTSYLFPILYQSIALKKYNTVFTYCAIYFPYNAGIHFGSDINREYVLCNNPKYWKTFLLWEFKQI